MVLEMEFSSYPLVIFSHLGQVSFVCLPDYDQMTVRETKRKQEPRANSNISVDTIVISQDDTD